MKIQQAIVVPNTIQTLTDLRKWFENNNLSRYDIIITRHCLLRRLAEFDKVGYRWIYYQGVHVYYHC